MDKFVNQVISLSKSIDYSQDAIVSKIIYKSDHTILTLFALAEGQSIAEHVTPFDAQVQVLEGKAELVIGGEKKIVKAGESIIMPANVAHALFAKQAYKMLLTMMK
ncbi:cupin domain-containing protein [Candidatus Margulisiibacteriota bacterium]